jgi:glutathione synthase/RimK-type ligase-like ATP-grasp enzyme
VEEKQLMVALAEAGFAVLPLSPAADPAPLGPSPRWPLADASASGVAAQPIVVIDRLQDRALASATLRVKRAEGATIVGAGIAGIENRLVVAMTLSRAGLPRPQSYVVHDETSALAAVELTGYPATFLPLESKADGLVLFDRDTAEAVMEHRDVLGVRHDALGIMQAGSAGKAITVIVAGGQAIGWYGNGDLAITHSFELAKAAAAAMHADLAGIVLVETPTGAVIWDIDPMPDFRAAQTLGDETVASAIVRALRGKLAGGSLSNVIVSSWEASHDIVAHG